MPTIYEYFGLKFSFYSKEHEPVHVHAKSGGCESVLEIIIEKGELKAINVRHVKGKRPLTAKDEKAAKEFVAKYYQNIIEKWKNVFLLNKEVRTTHIRKRI